MVRLTGNLATNAGVAICGGTVVYFPTSVNATESTAANSGTADTTNSSGVFQCLGLAANKYDIRVNCGSAFRWDRYADEIQHATFQTGDGCSSGLEGNFYWGLGLDAGIRWSTADASNHALVIATGTLNEVVHITSMTDIAIDWNQCPNASDTEVQIHSSTSPAANYLMIGRHTGTIATIDVVGGATLNLDISGTTEGHVDACGFCTITGNFYAINNTSVLNATTLGSGVTASSLTSVGTLTSLAMGGDIDLNGSDIDDGGVIFLREQACADADVAGQGQIWVNTATPNQLFFTNDAGTDFQLCTGGITINCNTNNNVITATGNANCVKGEGNLTFNGTTLALTGGITLSGALDANGTVDADVTDFDVLSSGDIDMVSSANAAAAIYIAQSTGTSGTIKIHADTGTSVTEGAESVNILSDVGGVGIRSTANLANAVNITADGGSTSTIQIYNDQGTSVTEGAASIALVSDAGGVELRSTANLANAINITNDGGTTGTISIFNDQGSSVTEGAESISLLSDAGGVGIRSTANLANAVNISADGGTTSTIQIFNDQGTAVNEGVASIQLLSDVGGIGVKSGLNAAGAIRLTADAGTSETIILHADQGSGTDSICLTSDAGGITLNPGTFITVGGIADGEIRIMEDSGAGTNYAAIKVQNMGASYTLTLPADDGCCGEFLKTNGSGVLDWAAGGGGACAASIANMELRAWDGNGSPVTNAYVSPGRMIQSPGVAKSWAMFQGNVSTPTEQASWNVEAIVDHGAGCYSLDYITPMCGAAYVIFGMSNQNGSKMGSAPAGGTTGNVSFFNNCDTQVDTSNTMIIAFAEGLCND